MSPPVYISLDAAAARQGCKRPRWAIFAVDVDGYSTEYFAATTQSKARARAFLTFSVDRPITFRDFLTRSKVRRIRGLPPTGDCYDGVRRQYGVDVTVGQRVRLINEGSASGQQGEVIYPGRSTSHVHVVVDGRDFAIIVHPMNVEILPA